MKTRYILATTKTAPDVDSFKIWLPMNNSNIFHLSDNGIIWSIKGVNNKNCDMLCDVNTHERYMEIEKFGASNPLELIMKLDLYPNLYLEI